MNQIKITAGDDISTTRIFLNGEPVKYVTRVEFVADCNDPDGFLRVKLTLLAGVELEGSAEVEIQHREVA